MSSDQPLEILVSRILERGVGADEAINPFWQGQLAAFRQALERDRTATADAVFQLGYYERELGEGVSNRELPEWPKIKKAARKADAEGLDKAQTEHAGAIAVLMRNGLLDEYLATLDRVGLGSGMAIARHWFYLQRLRRYRSEPGNMLEIGAGSGYFAYLAIDAGLVRHYVIVDFAEMLINSCATLSRRLPGANLHVGEAPDFDAPGLHIWLLEPSEFDGVPDRSIDIAANFNSFMEMDEDVRDGYLRQIYNVNRMQRTMSRRDGTPYENNPLLYPYRATDQVLEWEPDDMQQSIRSSRFHAPSKSFCVARIARVGE
jgi:putative sugar O-methyltransferase